MSAKEKMAGALDSEGAVLQRRRQLANHYLVVDVDVVVVMTAFVESISRRIREGCSGPVLQSLRVVDCSVGPARRSCLGSARCLHR